VHSVSICMYSCGRQHICGNLSKAVICGIAAFKVLVLPCPCLLLAYLTGKTATLMVIAPRALDYSFNLASRKGHWTTSRIAQPSEQLQKAAMLSLQQSGTGRKPKMLISKQASLADCHCSLLSLHGRRGFHGLLLRMAFIGAASPSS
jgi:hypothetical protein